MALTFRAMALAILCCVVSSPVRAEELPPHFDVHQLCEWHVEKTGPTLRESEYTECFHRNQEAYEELRPLWPKLSAPIKRSCLEMARDNGPGSYDVLAACVSSELKQEAAKAKKPDAQFKF
jgi:hypothetical protein